MTVKQLLNKLIDMEVTLRFMAKMHVPVGEGHRPKIVREATEVINAARELIERNQ